MHPPLSRVRASVWRLRNVAVGKFAVCIPACGVCADIRDACAPECEKYSDVETMRKCAEARRRSGKTRREVPQPRPVPRPAHTPSPDLANERGPHATTIL